MLKVNLEPKFLSTMVTLSETLCEKAIELHHSEGDNSKGYISLQSQGVAGYSIRFYYEISSKKGQRKNNQSPL